jgi:hypothetical protein
MSRQHPSQSGCHSWLADNVEGGPVPVGHFIPEETSQRLLEFLR